MDYYKIVISWGYLAWLYFVVMAMVVVGSTCVPSFTVLFTSIAELWARMCNYCLWSFDKVVMATVVVGCMCVQITTGEGTGIKQIQPKKWFIA